MFIGSSIINYHGIGSSKSLVGSSDESTININGSDINCMVIANSSGVSTINIQGGSRYCCCTIGIKITSCIDINGCSSDIARAGIGECTCDSKSGSSYVSVT